MMTPTLPFMGLLYFIDFCFSKINISWMSMDDNQCLPMKEDTFKSIYEFSSSKANTLLYSVNQILHPNVLHHFGWITFYLLSSIK